jgi:hypothetical protein
MVPSCMMHTPHWQCEQWDVKYQSLSVLPVLLCLPASFERRGLWARVLDNCSSFFWWGCEYWYSCWQTHTVNSNVVDVCFELCYWPARSFSRTSRRCTSLFCHWVLIHGWLTLSVTFCQDDDVISGEFLTLPRCYTLYPYQLCLVPTHVVFVTIAI